MLSCFSKAGLLWVGACVSVGALAADEIVIGRSLPLTGPTKTYGEAKRDGADAYLERVNKAGGVGGHLISVVTLNDEYQPDKLLANLDQLVNKHAAVAVLGLFGVPTIAAALPKLQELKIPAVGLTSGTNGVRKPFNPYAFPVRASYASEARKLVGHVKTMGVSRIGVVFTDNPFGVSVKDTLLAALKDEGLEAKAVSVDPAGAAAGKAVAEVLAANPQSVFLTMLSQAAVPVLRELKQASQSTLLYTFSPVDTTLIQKELGAKASGLGITQIVPIPDGKRDRIVVEYTQALKDLGRGSPSFYGLEAYIEAKVLVEGLRRSGGKPTSASLARALETMQPYDLGGFVVNYSPTEHQGGSFVEVDVIDSTGTVRR
jgi:ABC-type branched-subunit amino acid transport system substrate-binding protein